MDQSEEFLENPRDNHLPSLKGLNEIAPAVLADAAQIR